MQLTEIMLPNKKSYIVGRAGLTTSRENPFTPSGHTVPGTQAQPEMDPSLEDAFSFGSYGRARPASASVKLTADDARTVRVLVAEDNAMNAKVITAMLDRLGVEHAVVPNGLMAVEAVKIVSFDLILMDCQMPIMDGLSATREIRQLESTGAIAGQGIDVRATPIVALTANCSPSDRIKCLDAGMDDFAGKPIQLQELRDLIQRNIIV